MAGQIISRDLSSSERPLHQYSGSHRFRERYYCARQKNRILVITYYDGRTLILYPDSDEVQFSTNGFWYKKEFVRFDSIRSVEKLN